MFIGDTKKTQSCRVCCTTFQLSGQVKCECVTGSMCLKYVFEPMFTWLRSLFSKLESANNYVQDLCESQPLEINIVIIRKLSGLVL